MQTDLSEDKLHVAELSVFPQLSVIFVKGAFRIARELIEQKRRGKNIMGNSCNLIKNSTLFTYSI